MIGNLRAIWGYRYFWLALVRMDLRTRYDGSSFGLGWALLRPLPMTAILCTVFHRIFDTDPWSYAPFLLAGLACWQYLMGVTTQGAKSFVRGETYIRQHPAPLAIYPLRVTLCTMVQLVPALSIAIVLQWYAHGFGNAAALLSLVPNLGILFLFGWSVAILIGLANTFARDVQHVAEVGFQIMFYVTPVLYPGRVLRVHGLEWVNDYNPLVAFLSLIRDPIIEGRLAPWGAYAFASTTTLVLCLAASAALARIQQRLVFYL
jgi:ABC-type polysaccharide/polyol phosphate export permease